MTTWIPADLCDDLSTVKNGHVETALNLLLDERKVWIVWITNVMSSNDQATGEQTKYGAHLETFE